MRFLTMGGVTSQSPYTHGMRGGGYTSVNEGGGTPAWKPSSTLSGGNTPTPGGAGGKAGGAPMPTPNPINPPTGGKAGGAPMPEAFNTTPYHEGWNYTPIPGATPYNPTARPMPVQSRYNLMADRGAFRPNHYGDFFRAESRPEPTEKQAASTAANPPPYQYQTGGLGSFSPFYPDGRWRGIGW